MRCHAESTNCVSVVSEESRQAERAPYDSLGSLLCLTKIFWLGIPKLDNKMTLIIFKLIIAIELNLNCTLL